KRRFVLVERSRIWYPLPINPDFVFLPKIQWVWRSVSLVQNSGRSPVKRGYIPPPLAARGGGQRPRARKSLGGGASEPLQVGYGSSADGAWVCVVFRRGNL